MTSIKAQSIEQWFDTNDSGPLLIAGPCSVESPEQVLETAQQIRANAPISLLRGGVWKPRTKPGSFEGVGAEAMRWLIDAGKAINTPTTVEVANAEHVELALKEGADVLWIGARTTVNPFYVQEIAEALKGVNIPVLVKNPIHAEIGLWAGAIERFQKAGTKRIAAVHRGFFSTAKSIYRNEPEWQHSFDLRALMPEIKIICDPSHIAGDRSLIKEVSQVAMDLGMEGLMIETHRDPDCALSDANQQITPAKLGAIIRELKIHTEIPLQPNAELATLREALDVLDDAIVDVLQKRFAKVKDIAAIKEREGLSIFHMERWLKLVQEQTSKAEGKEMSPAFIHELFALIHKYSVDYQTELIKKKFLMRWSPKPAPEAGITPILTAEVTKDPLLSHLLAVRGIEDFSSAKEFFRPDLKHLHDPYRMKDMEAAVERIEQARINQEHVMIYGDYDVDGTTSVALMSDFLDGKFPIEAYIPDRYKEGYGLSFEGINLAAELGITLIIALDCGIKAFDQIAHARQLGIDIIVCDHHRPEQELPLAKAILNPKRPDCLYPYKELSGCGVGFKLCQALCERWGLPHEYYLYPLLDLCAISIAADIVHVTGENRILAHFGMERLRNGESRPGIAALLQVAAKNPHELNFRDLGFTIGPRINAAGRMESGLRAVELLRSKEGEAQQDLAHRIQQFNTERREVQGQIFEEAKDQLDPDNYPFSNVLYSPEWHKGVVGIVASKIVETRYRPTIVLTKSGDKLAGSARSVTDFDLYEALSACEEHLIQFGGHKYAAGMTLHESQLPHFKAAFEAYCQKNLSPDQLEQNFFYDAQAHLSQFTDRFHKILKQLDPHGPENPAPIFLLKNLVDAGQTRAVGGDKTHLKLNVKHQEGGPAISGIAFNQGHLESDFKAGTPFDALITLTENHFRGQMSIEIMVESLRPAE